MNPEDWQSEPSPRFIGIDSGPFPGIVMLSPIRTPVVIQCSANVAPEILHMLLTEDCEVYGTTWVQCEAYVRSNIKASESKAGRITRDLTVDFEHVCHQWGSPCAKCNANHALSWRLRRAVDVKPWATDERLAKAGLMDETKGMTHARDGARHALYLACRDGGMRDPLSRRRTS